MTTGSAWSVRPSTPADLPAIRRLYSVVFGERSLAHDTWKFEDNPHGAGIGMLAVVGDDVVGQYVLLPTALRIGGAVVSGAQSLDTMVHPGYRGQGLFTTLASACYDLAAQRGVEVLYGVPNASSYPGFCGRLQWTHTGNLDRWARPLDASEHRRVPALARPLASLVMRLARAGDVRAGGCEVRAGRPADAELDRLLAAGADDAAVCRIERSRAWCDWRFDGTSGHDYQWVTACRDGVPRAAVVWSRALGRIADFLGEDAEALEAAVATVLLAARAQGIGTLRTLSNEAPVVRALKACGFLQREAVPWIVKLLTTRPLGVDPLAHATWRVKPADLDGF